MKRLRTRSLAAFGVLALAGCVSLGTTYSGLNFDPGDRFIVGGHGSDAFRIELQNEGPVPVALTQQTPEGDLVPLDTLGVDERRSVRFEAGHAIILTNTTDGRARVAVKTRGGKEPAMRRDGKK